MLWGYFDESGTDGQNGCTVISGFIGPLDEWSSVLAGWKSRLLRDEINTFHYVECKGRNGEYWSWTREKCKEHLDALAEIITMEGLAGLNAGFMGDYAAILPTLPAHFQAYYPTAYSLCLELMVNRIRQASEAWQKQPIALIFSHHQKFTGMALERWELNRQGGHWPEIDHIGYNFPDKIPQLQTADMLAWETRRFMTDRVPPTLISDLPLLSRLVAKHMDAENSLYEVQMNEASLRAFAADMPH